MNVIKIRNFHRSFATVIKTETLQVLLILNYMCSSTLHSCIMQITSTCAHKIYKYLMHMENVCQA